MRISDWSSDVCSSDLSARLAEAAAVVGDDAMAWRELVELRLPHAAVGDAGMEEDHGRSQGVRGTILHTGQARLAAGDGELLQHGDPFGGETKGARNPRPEGDRKSTRLNSSH